MSKFSFTSVRVLCSAEYCTYCCFFHSNDVMYQVLLERYQSQIIQILKFLVFIVLAGSFYIIFLILNYTILFVRVAVVVNFINKFCSRFRTAYLSGSANSAMAFSCSFHSRTGTSCSYDRLDKNKKGHRAF